MLHAVLGVLLAFLGTDPARLGTCLKRGPDHCRIRCGLPGHDLAGGIADVGTVEIEADAAGQHLGLLFAKTGICT